TTETYTENGAGTGGTLTISDGTNTANLNFTGSYTLANFKFSSDGSGGTLIIDPPTVGTEPTLITDVHGTDDDPSPGTLGHANDAPPHHGTSGNLLADLIESFENGQGNTADAVTNLVEQLESANNPKPGDAVGAQELHQLQQLVQSVLND